MATESGQGTTFNLPNYTGELFSTSPSDTPFLSAIGGLSGGRSTNHREFEWQTEGLESTSANNVAKEGADAPAASEVSRDNVSNVVEIHHEAVEISYSKLASTGQLDGIGVEGTNPVRNELDHQVALKLRKIGVDVEKSFLSGTYNKATSTSEANKTRGVLSAVSTNKFTGSTAGTTRSLTKKIVNEALRDMYKNGAPLDQDNTVLMVDPTVKVWLSDLFGGKEPQSRTVGGVNIETIVTDFGVFGVMLNRWVPTVATNNYRIAVVDLSVCAPVFLTIPGKGHLFAEPLARTGSAESYQLYGEIGLEYGPESYHGDIQDLKAPA